MGLLHTTDSGLQIWSTCVEGVYAIDNTATAETIPEANEETLVALVDIAPPRSAAKSARSGKSIISL